MNALPSLEQFAAFLFADGAAPESHYAQRRLLVEYAHTWCNFADVSRSAAVALAHELADAAMLTAGERHAEAGR